MANFPHPVSHRQERKIPRCILGTKLLKAEDIRIRQEEDMDELGEFACQGTTVYGNHTKWGILSVTQVKWGDRWERGHVRGWAKGCSCMIKHVMAFTMVWRDKINTQYCPVKGTKQEGGKPLHF